MRNEQTFSYTSEERSACGVGFITSRNNSYSNQNLKEGLHALKCVEHRGACTADGLTGDGAGIMTDIPFDLLGFEMDTVAVATLFLTKDRVKQDKALNLFEQTFKFFGLEVLQYRDVPVNPAILGPDASETLPDIKHAIIQRPKRARTDLSFDKRLYNAKQLTKSKLSANGLDHDLFFTSLSAKTIIYKALCKTEALADFYPDLQNPKYETRFCLFHRRFSTNTTTTWDKAQPFRLIGHNGEINTIAGNRSWAKSREKMIGAERNEILTRSHISDSGSLNEMVEALRYRSSIPNVEDILAIMMPPAVEGNDFYKFWSRAMEPWDGPAFITYANGYTIGARLDRNGFRPCRWIQTNDHFYLSSEAGTFEIDEEIIEGKGTLYAGRGVTVDLSSGEVLFRDPSFSKDNHDATFDPRLKALPSEENPEQESFLDKLPLFSYSDEELNKVIEPMALTGKEPIGSMGDTARLAILSDEPRSFFDFFFQHFSQVTNPPLDYIREEIVTDINVYLGKKPNIFEPKELIPAAPAYESKSPFLTLQQMDYLVGLTEKNDESIRVSPYVIQATFKRTHGVVGFKAKLKSIADEAVEAVKNGHTIIILSDRNVDYENPALPSLLTLRSVVNTLNDEGLKLNASVICDTGEVKSTHQASALIGFGAQAVCPYLMLNLARDWDSRKMNALEASEKEKNVINALNKGLLKIMAKSGISVVRSYQSSKLYSAVGLGHQLIQEYFPGIQSPISGLEIDEIAEMTLKRTAHLNDSSEDMKPLLKSYQFKEHARGKEGEKHSMTNTRSKIIHDLVQKEGLEFTDMALFDEYLKLGLEDEPITLRHLLSAKAISNSIPLDQVAEKDHIFKTFGSGAMSFGAISAEAQRDIFEAMSEIGGRSNSGEGGENPYYFTDGISASVKQIASGRFGVTAEYLVSGEEIQIKVCQGAKPGEGGQLMGVKVIEDIAKARFANPGFDLISPPPLHDIYSIEDLKQLIHDLKQLHPGGKVSVKLVSGVNIGTIAVGVAKAGADIIQISGGEGGTGAASLSSMKHAGLPWEIGLLEAHQSLVENDLRDHVILRTDGGISAGKDIIIASILGAEQFDFGKFLLIAEGCVMARICEKNTCPRGIATHDPKFKAKYVGTKDHIVKALTYLAEDVRRILAEIGVESLNDLNGKTEYLTINEKHQSLINVRGIDLSFFLNAPSYSKEDDLEGLSEPISALNGQMISDMEIHLESNKPIKGHYSISNTDRSTIATLAGFIAKKKSDKHLELVKQNKSADFPIPDINLQFKGSAGQSFGVFQIEGIDIRLTGEANDSVCKSMAGGKTVIVPPENANYNPADNAIIGNCALYGATGGSLYVHGQAGDRFAVRNSGATAVVEGTGLHACEYMTNGTVVILGSTSQNIGAGMTGGELYMFEDPGSNLNKNYLAEDDLSTSDLENLNQLLQDYFKETASAKAEYILSDWDNTKESFKKFIPIAFKVLKDQAESQDIEA